MLPFTRLAVAACLLYQALHCSGEGDIEDLADPYLTLLPFEDAAETPPATPEAPQPESSPDPYTAEFPAFPPEDADDEEETPPLTPRSQESPEQAEGDEGLETAPPAASPGGGDTGPDAAPEEETPGNEDIPAGSEGADSSVPSSPPDSSSGQDQEEGTQVPGDSTGDSTEDGAGDGAEDGPSSGTAPGDPGDSDAGDGASPDAPDATPPEVDDPAEDPDQGEESDPDAGGEPEPDAPSDTPGVDTPEGPPADDDEQEEPPEEGPEEEGPPADEPEEEGPPEPISVIKVPATSGLCSEIVLSAKGSESNMSDAPELTYTWFNTQSASLSFVNFLAAQKGEEVTIPKETVYAAAKQYLARNPGASTIDVEFTVEVANKAGGRSTASGTVTLSLFLEPPSLALNSASEFTISKGDSVSLSVIPSFCPLVQSGFDPGVALQWIASCIKDPRTADELLRLDEKQTTATVRPFSLIPGYTYTVEASIRYTANAALKASQTFKIHVRTDKVNVRFQLVNPSSESY